MSGQNELPDPEFDGATATRQERRRRGRIEYKNLALIALFRQAHHQATDIPVSSEFDDTELDFRHEGQTDGLDPARGILIALPVGLGLWGVIVVGIWWLIAQI